MPVHKITMLGAGLIGRFYTESLHAQRSRDRVHVLYSQTEERARRLADEMGIAKATADLRAAVFDPETDVVVVGLPNHRHEEAVTLAVQAGKAVLCTNPSGAPRPRRGACSRRPRRPGSFTAISRISPTHRRH
jgi:predicted dehydrogenase